MWKPFDTFITIVWPKYKEKERKQEFLAKLKGTSKICIRAGTPVGVTFMVGDQITGYVDQYFQIGPDEWISWGQTPNPTKEPTRTFTTLELEVYLTKQMRTGSPTKPINIIDENSCIVFN